MAQAPSPEQIKSAQIESQKIIDAKIASQQKKGKDFIIDESGHAAGVIPEKEWKKMKAQS